MSLDDFKTIADIIQATLTSFAIIIGGVWTYDKFIRMREKYPRAKCTHKIIEKPLRNELLIHVCVEITNIGEVLLSLVSYDVRIYQINPLSTELERQITEKKFSITEGEREIDWPLIGSRKGELGKSEYEIEPKETQVLHFDFPMDYNVRGIQIYSYMKNATKKGREIGWDCISFYDLIHKEVSMPKPEETKQAPPKQAPRPVSPNQAPKKPNPSQPKPSEQAPPRK